MSELLNGKGEGFRLVLLVFGLAVAIFGVASLISTSSAKADETTDPLVGINCTGKVEAITDSIFSDSFTYEFGCDKDISALTIVSNRELGSFSTEIIGVNAAGEPGVGQDFFCVGAVPSSGFGCYGNPGKTPATVITAGNKGIGEFSMFNPVCDANAQPMFWGIAQTVYSTTNDLDPLLPPVVRTWTATTEPFPLDVSAIECEVLNPKVKARQLKMKAKVMCSKVKKTKSKQARLVAKKKCDRARAAVPKAS